MEKKAVPADPLFAADEKPAIGPELKDFERMLEGKPAERRSA
jgi:hypothetical protein